MRRLTGFILLAVTTGLVWLLDHPIGPVPGLGRLMDPINGFWANAEPANKNFSADLSLPNLKPGATVWIDKHLVPHIHATNDHDAYFLEGYIHAQFRLWEMDMASRAAAGRVSEIVGEKALEFDRKQRRKGMVYAAENSLAAMNADPRTKTMMDAYTEGINCYISSMKFRDYPLEYKLMGFCPEPWRNLKSALMLKYMADDLTGTSNDIPLTYLREVLPADEFKILFPETISNSSPVIPRGTVFDKPSLQIPATPADTVFPHFTKKEFTETKEDGIGSNNWAINGSRTASGSAILCNDPHLKLNLPSIWYQVQLQAPGMNVYGVSLPGAPGVIIGFNDSVSWGFTNNYRDVKDYYLIKEVAGDKSKYWFDGKQEAYKPRIEKIPVRNQKDFIDTVNYTVHGPVMYTEQYPADGGLHKPLAMCWMAHKKTNELLSVYLINRAGNYDQFVDAILNFQCPAQNMVFADRKGNVALWGQGQFVNKWKGQGRFIMDGSTKSTLWGDLIPMRENPHVVNPMQGYVASANQCVTDSTYPYYYDGDFVELRAWRINQVLGSMQKATVKDMFALQNDTYSILASRSLPVLLKYLPANPGEKEKKYIDDLKKWDYKLDANSREASLFQWWWTNLYNKIWAGFNNVPGVMRPLTERTLQLIEDEDAGKVKIAQLEHMDILIKNSFQQAFEEMSKAGKTGQEWYKVKNTSVTHLTKIPAFSFTDLQIGGWGNTVNAAKGDHGPSWRMVVQMSKEIEAYGIYPGGQSGNPGSKYYADYLDNWVKGQYNKLLFLPNTDQQADKEVIYTWTIHQ